MSRKPSDTQSSLQPIVCHAPEQTVTVAGPPQLGILAHYSALPAVEGAGVMTTLDLTRRENLITVQNALSGKSESLWDIDPQMVIHVQHVIAHYAERVDEETGEETSGPMLTLIGPDGNYHTGSKYAFRALQAIACLCGPAPWNPPIALRAVRQRSRNKREYQSLILVE